MFDKYKNEIEDLRRSRTSLHQIPAATPQEHIKEHNLSPNPLVGENIIREYSREAFSKTDVHTITGGNARQQSGYTVSSVPQDWNLPRERNSRVVEVADTFIGKSEGGATKTNRYGGRITVEEVLDSIFQETVPVHEPLDPSLPQSNQPPPQNADGPGIYSSNYKLMDKVIEQPHLAESLLKKEPLYIRCSHCQKTRHLKEARNVYVSCKHCYSYYCSRACSQGPETQYHMSRVAREGYRKEGRGSVNIRLISAHSAQLYLDDGWKVFASHDPNQLLFYYPIQSLIEQRKEPSLIQLCRKYNPTDKFILSVSIIADIEQCPETPPPEPITFSHSSGYSQQQHRIPLIPASHQPYSAIVPTNV
uniref:Apical junction molecule ajm1 alpha/beta domain-containing protein n=1 Tax=Ditylenchus dipsaci TaxID=166011 RepID=A0A915CQZ0_9BILA